MTVEEARQVVESSPWMNYVFMATIAFAALWLVLSVFVHLRRKASNLTPVNAARARKSARPDFMKVDHKARKAALERGEAYDEKLDERDAAEAAEAAGVKQATVASRLAKLASLLFSIFSLAAVSLSVVRQVKDMTAVAQEYSAGDRLMAIITQHPMAVAISVFIIGFHIVRFVLDQRSGQPATR